METDTRDSITTEIKLRLGDQMVSVELDPEHYNLAINKSLEKYRQRSENAVEENFVPLELQIDQTHYKLGPEIIEVRDIYQRASGTRSTGTGNEIEPFEAQYLNTYLLQSGRAGGLAVYDALAQHHEVLGRIFGAEYLFTWYRTKCQLFIHRRPKARNLVYLHVYQYRPEDDLFMDQYANPWLKDYALAQAKMMLAEARRKFAVIPGPSGGTTLNGEQMATDAKEEMEKLEEDLRNFRDGSAPTGIIIG